MPTYLDCRCSSWLRAGEGEGAEEVRIGARIGAFYFRVDERRAIVACASDRAGSDGRDRDARTRAHLLMLNLSAAVAMSTDPSRAVRRSAPAND